MKYLFRDRLSDGSLVKVVHNIINMSYISDHHDYHPHFEIYYNHKYQPQNVTINSKVFKTVTPCVTISSPFTIHDMVPTEENQYFDCYVIFISENLFPMVNDFLLTRDCMNTVSNCIFPLTDSENNHLISILNMLTDPQISQAEINLYLLIFINSLLRMIPEERRIHIDKADYYITDVLTYIYQNISTVTCCQDIIDEFHVSFSKLNRDFKHFLGLTVHQTIVNCRISHAVDLLSNTNLKIKDIANKCGFENEYYFYSFFKSQTNKTPSSYRKHKQ